MACHHPLNAWRRPGGKPVVGNPPTGLSGAQYEFLRLPCGRCLGCNETRAKHWALRCQLELNDHPTAAFVTLTYADEFLPPTLRKADLSAFLKRLRARISRHEEELQIPRDARRRIRFFASGEYGDRFQRPHYHALLFGVDPLADREHIRLSWGVARRNELGEYDDALFQPFGILDIDKVTPKVISYVAGYCSKKLGWRREATERVDPDTGEVYRFQPPFTLASGGGFGRVGIGGRARDAYPRSWRDFAVLGGARTSVPRYLHEGWRRVADPEDLQQLEADKKARAVFRSRDELDAAEANAMARKQHAEQRRRRR